MAHNSACANSKKPPWECECPCGGTLHGRTATGAAVAGVEYSIPPEEPLLTREWLAGQTTEFRRGREVLLPYARRAHRDNLERYADWSETLPWPERQSVVDYRGDGYGPVNAANRGLRRMNKKWRLQTRAVDRAIYSAPPTDRDLVVYRNFGYPELVALWRSGELEADYRFEEAAYSSTSLDIGVARKYNEDSGGLVGRLTLPRGTPAAYLDVVHDMGEREMLLPRGVGFEFQGWTTFRGLRIARFEAIFVPDTPVDVPYAPYVPKRRRAR